MSRGIVSANAYALHAKLCLVLAVGLIVTQTVSKYSSAENPIMLTKTFTPIDYHLFDPGNRVHSSASPTVRDLIQIGPPGIIRPPIDGQHYDVWLEAMHLDRKSAFGLDLDDSSKHEMLYTIDFQGHRGSWLRLNETLSRALELKSGEELTWKISTRAKKDGNCTFYFAFDIHNHQGRKIGWSDLDDFPVEIPRDGRWHTVTVKATVPEFNKDEVWVRPIFGMDQVCDPTSGKIDRCLKRNAARTGPHAWRMMFAIARNRWCIPFPTDRPS